MKTKILFQIVSIFLITLILLASCVSTTMIQSTPTGARLSIDGSHAGKTPFTYRDTKIVGSNTTVKLELEGYETIETLFSRSEEADIGAIVGGFFLLIPWFWIMKYKPIHSYELIQTSDLNKPNIRTLKDFIPNSKTERLLELKKLLDQKLITQEEYEKERKKIIEEKYQ